MALLQILHQGRLAVLVAPPDQRALEQRFAHGLVVGGRNRLFLEVAQRLDTRQNARRHVGGIVGQHAHIVNVLAGCLVHRLEGRGALTQVAHGAHGLVPQRHLALVGKGLAQLVQGTVLELQNLGAAEHQIICIAFAIRCIALHLVGVQSQQAVELARNILSCRLALLHTIC